MNALIQALLVAVGSALGGLARWGVGLAVGRFVGGTWPVATFAVNLSGCFLLGWFMTMVTDRHGTLGLRWLRPDDLRLLVAVGFTGAYTTFSTFELEAHGLLHTQGNLAGTAYLVASVVLGLIAVRAGIALAQ